MRVNDEAKAEPRWVDPHALVDVDSDCGGDFVLSPNAPVTVTPGDEFEVSVGVGNNVTGSGPAAEIDVENARERFREEEDWRGLHRSGIDVAPHRQR